MMFVIPNVIDSSMLCRHHEEIHVCYEDTKNLFCSSLSPRKNGKDLLGTSLLDLLPANVIQVMQNEGTSLMTIHVGRTGFAGLSLVYGLTLSGTLVFFIQYVCQLANNIVSVERICQYMDIPSEAPAIIKDHRPPANWPLEGKIDLQNLQVIFVQLKFAANSLSLHLFAFCIPTSPSPYPHVCHCNMEITNISLPV